MTTSLMVLAQAVALTVTDPATLSALERQGLSLGRQLDGSSARRGSELVDGPGYRSMMDLISSDLGDVNTRAALSHPAYQGKWQGFDVRWLAAERAQFELVALVHRPDRRHVVPDSCGETRLVYRLRYVEGQGENVTTRGLPMTASLVYTLPKARPQDFCHPSVYDQGVADILAGQRPFTRLELNLQSGRWPNDASRQFSEQVHYLMRSLARTDEGPTLVPLKLENQPDVQRLNATPAIKRKLRDWLLAPANQARINHGTFAIPEEFAARRAISVSPFGLSRGANRPFAALFTAADFPGVEKPERFLRRLDGGSCVGCHQSRAIAGFHVLGEDRHPVPSFDRMVTPFSAYFVEIQPWRRESFLAALGEAPPESPAPFAEASTGVFAVCGLEGGEFTDWQCNAGLTCRADRAPGGAKGVGRCAPATEGLGGDPCDHGALVTSFDPLSDLWRAEEVGPCPAEGVCATSQHGFPGGLCASSCRPGTKSVGTGCVPVPILGPFSACLNRGEAFAQCLATHSRPTSMPACSSIVDCRSDFVCLADPTSPGAGICTPPYFLPQLTVEHQPRL